MPLSRSLSQDKLFQELLSSDAVPPPPDPELLDVFTFSSGFNTPMKRCLIEHADAPSKSPCRSRDPREGLCGREALRFHSISRQAVSGLFYRTRETRGSERYRVRPPLWLRFWPQYRPHRRCYHGSTPFICLLARIDWPRTRWTCCRLLHSIIANLWYLKSLCWALLSPEAFGEIPGPLKYPIDLQPDTGRLFQWFSYFTIARRFPFMASNRRFLDDGLLSGRRLSHTGPLRHRPPQHYQRTFPRAPPSREDGKGV